MDEAFVNTDEEFIDYYTNRVSEYSNVGGPSYGMNSQSRVSYFALDEN